MVILINTCSLIIQLLIILALKISRKNSRRELFYRFFSVSKRQRYLNYRKSPIINIYITYKTLSKTVNSEFTLRNCLFGAVKIANTSNSDKEMWQYNGME